MKKPQKNIKTPQNPSKNIKNRQKPSKHQKVSKKTKNMQKTMKNIKNLMTSLTVAALLLGTTLNFNACSEDSPLGPQAKNNVGQVAQSNIGTIHILGAEEAALSKGKAPEESVFFAEKLIKANKGGKIEIGNKDVGKSKIDFPKKALPEDMLISFEWAASGTLIGMLSSIEFGPHGLEFNEPVKVELSYKTADLKGVDEKKLSIFYFNEDTGLWEFIGGKVDKKGKKV